MKMGAFVNLYILILVYTSLVTRKFLVQAKDKTKKDFEIIKFKVPHIVWKQALHPTPVLKSPVTIVLPINVQDDGGDDEIEDNVTENVEVDANLVDTEQIVLPAQDEIVTPPQDPVPVAEVSIEAPEVQDEVIQNPQEDVPGQVIKFPCSCLSGQCGCCTGALMERFRIKACGNMTFIPEDFLFDVRLSVNNNTVVRRRVSASDPPPICFNPRRAPFVRVCAEISNIRIRNRNAHACLDINADIGGFPIYSTSFRCFSFGTSGVKTGLKPKPVSSGPKPVNLFGNSGQNAGGGLIENAAGAVLGAGQGIFGGSQGGGILGDGIFGGAGTGGAGGGGGGDAGPFDAIGDALGDFLDDA